MMETPVRFGGTTSKQFEGIERRQSVRFPSSLDAICWQPGSPRGEPWSAIVENISVGGIGLLCRRPIVEGSLFLIKLQNNFVDMSSPMHARAVHVSAKGEESWLIGCQFLHELDEKQAEDLAGQDTDE
jgi:c-di-GMP-binding flagellar brake protein YcgR